jgi:hypothetical protein
MGHPLETDVISAPTRWILVFDREAASWWTSFIAFGRYKHVRAFGFVHDADSYVFYDVQFTKTTIQIARGAGARALMLDWTVNADVLRYDGRFSAEKPGGKAGKTPAFWGRFFRPFGPFRPLLCTTAIAHLIGLPGGALRPDALYRQCLRNGAVAIHGLTQSTSPAARPDARPVDGDGAAAANHGVAG